MLCLSLPACINVSSTKPETDNDYDIKQCELSTQTEQLDSKSGVDIPDQQVETVYQINDVNSFDFFVTPDNTDILFKHCATQRYRVEDKSPARLQRKFDIIMEAFRSGDKLDFRLDSCPPYDGNPEHLVGLVGWVKIHK